MTAVAAILLFGSFALSLCLTAIVKIFAVKAGFVSRPSSDRYNPRIVPMGGGIAIFATIFIVLIAVICFVKFFAANQAIDMPYKFIQTHTAGFVSKIPSLIVVLCCASGLFLLGLWDDKKKLGPFIKLAIEIIVITIAAVFADIRIEFFIHNKIITTILSVLWIAFIINAFNFLDNMDGACAGIATIVSLVLFAAAMASGQVFAGSMAIILAGALLGFLVFNFPPAKIFAGDCGSLVIGFFVALLTLRTTYYHQNSGHWYSVFLPLIAMAVPLYDFMSVTFLRIKQGKSPFVGDTQHFSHRLKKLGLTETQTVLTLYLATLCTSISAIFLYQVDVAGAVLIFLQTFMILTIIAVLESAPKNENNKSASNI